MVRNLFRTYRIGWAEVRRFADGSVGVGGENPVAWALRIVLHDGRIVTAAATRTPEWSAKPLLAIVQAAERYDIPADLTGTIERGLFPATLLGASGTIMVTICDGHLAGPGSEAVLEVVQRPEPVEPGDLLALSHDGAEVEVLGVRQVVVGRRWEQVAYAYLVQSLFSVHHRHPASARQLVLTHERQTFRSVDSCAGIRPGSDQFVTSGSSPLDVHIRPENYKVVHPHGSQRGSQPKPPERQGQWAAFGQLSALASFTRG